MTYLHILLAFVSFSESVILVVDENNKFRKRRTIICELNRRKKHNIDNNHNDVQVYNSTSDTIDEILLVISALSDHLGDLFQFRGGIPYWVLRYHIQYRRLDIQNRQIVFNGFSLDKSAVLDILTVHTLMKLFDKHLLK